MDTGTEMPTVKVTAVLASVGLTTAFAVGSTLAYLTDADTRMAEVGFMVPGDGGLITLTEARWDADTTGTDAKGRAYAARGILPGDTLVQDPKVTINEWETVDGRPAAASQPIYVFMRVTVPTVDVDGIGTRTLFDYSTGAGWALVARNDAATDVDGSPAAVYVYVYTGDADDVATTTDSHVSDAVVPRASVYGDDLPELFETVTYVGVAEASRSIGASRSVGIGAYAVQAASLRADGVATIYQIASGEDVGGWEA